MKPRKSTQLITLFTFYPRLHHWLTAALALILAMAVLPVPVALADTITVGSCDASDLVAAIDTANGNGEGDTIILQAGCTYTLSSADAPDPDGYGPVGLPPITSNIILQGNGAIITRSGSDPFRIFYVSDTGNLALENLTLSNGLAQGGNGGNALYDGAGGGAGMGGAIFNRGTLTVSGVTLTGNTAQGGDGGNDYSGSSAAAGGGGMGGDGQNGPGGNNGGDGGGVNGGTGGATPSTPQGGDGGTGGGGGGAAFTGAYGPGGNGGFGGGGGGGGWNGTSGGHGGFGGGGGGTQGTPYAPGGFGGGDGVRWSGGGGGGLGGAIFNDAGALLTIINSTLTGNTAQGGNGGAGSGGTAHGGSGYGGAVFNYNGTTVVTNATIAYNTVVGGTGTTVGNADGGGAYNYQDTGTASLTLKNTILSDTPTGNTDCYNNSGTVTAPASNRNLIDNNAGDVNACGIPYSSSDPQLGVLADNGGDTWTHALQEGSPAIDAGAADGAPATDQRGVARPQGVAFDIGSYEKAQVMLSLVKTVDDETPDPGQLVTYTVSVDNNGALTATNALISDTLPGGLTFVGPIILDPSSAGTTGTEPTLAYGLTITGEERVTVTFPVMVNTGLAGDTVIINTASITSAKVVTPQTGLVALTVNNVAPVAVDDSYSVNEGATLNATAATGVLSNDPPDLNGDTLTVTLDGNVSHGTLTLNADGSFTYQHNGGETTSDSFTYYVTDGIDDSNVATVNITINPINDRPNIVDDGAVTDRIVPTTVDVLANDSDADGNLVPSSVTVTRDSSYGSTTVNPTTGEITYTPAGDWSGNDNFEYQVCDDGTPLPAQCSSAKVHISQLNWSENFDSYANGSELHDLGAWEGWNDNPTYDAPVTDSESRSAPHSVDIHGSADLVQRFYGYTYGRWTFTAWQYIPNDFSGTSYFIMQNRYPNNLNWSVQVLFNSSNGRVHSDYDGSELDLITGQWVELRIEIDLDNDWQRFFYNDQLLYEKSWSAGVSGGGSLNIGALDLYANNASPIYYDDLSLSPAPIWDGGGVDNNWSTPRNWLGDVVPNASDVVFFNNTSDKDASIDGPVSVAGMVIETGYDGAITQGSDTLTITGVFTQAGGTFNGGSSPVDITINGDLVKSGGVFNANSSTVIFDGAGTQFLNTDAITFADVTVSNGVTLTTEADVTLTGILTNNGATQETKDVTGAGTIPFGLADISIDVTTQGTLSSLQVVRVDQDHPNAPSGLQTGKRWTLTPTGSGYAVNLTLPKSSPPDAYDLVCHYTGSGQVWDCSADSFDAVNNTVTRNGITQLSDWTLGRNEPPTAVDDDATVDEGGTVNTPNVLDNDSDPEGYGLTVNTTPASGPSYGALTLNANGTFSYTHDGSENHNDNFVYEVCDDFTPSQCAQATVNIAVNPVNDPPVATDDSAATDEDTAVTVDVLNNDSDVDGNLDPVSVTVIGGPTNGSTGVNPASGEITYTPDGDFDGSDSFEYQVCDDGTPLPAQCTSATVNVTINPVNDPPVTMDDSAATDEEVAVTVDVLNNDSDVDGNLVPSSVTVSSGPSNGSTGVNSTSGEITYTPDGDFDGSDSFEYQVCDDGTPLPAQCSTATVNVTVNPVNDPPVANDDADSTAEDTQATVDVLSNDSDIDGDALVIDSFDGTSTAGGSVSRDDQGNADPTDDELAYIPPINFGGSDTFTYIVSDGSLTDTATVEITVYPVNDPPLAIDDSAITDEEVAVTVDVLNNDSDVDGNLVPSSVTVSSGPSNGSTGVNPTSGEITYTPDENFNGSDSFEYQVCDDGTPLPAQCSTATVNVTVNPVNDPPVANDDAYSVAEGGTRTVLAPGVLLNDTDVDAGDTLAATLVSDPAHGALTFNTDGSFTYVHDGSETTSDSFTYQAYDGAAYSNVATVTMTIGVVNDAPVANDDAYTVDEGDTLTVAAAGVLANDTDGEGDPLAASLVSDVSNGILTLNTDGSFTYQHDGSETISDSFTYQAFDGADYSNIATVSITVNPVNDAPTVSDVSKTGSEDTTLTFAQSDFDDQFADVDGDSLITVKITSLPSHGTLNLDGNPVVADQEINAGDLSHLTYDPDANYQGTDSFGWNGSDGTVYAASDAQVNLTLNDLPSLIVVSKSANPTEIGEPGGTVTFTVRIENGSAVDSVTIVTLTDSIYDNLSGQGTCAVPQTIAAGEYYECAFIAEVTGSVGDSETNIVTAEGADDDGNPVTAFDDATVTIIATFTQLTVNIVGNGSVTQQPDQLTYRYGDVVTLTAIAATDWIFAGWNGDLTGTNNPETIIMTSNKTVTATFNQTYAPVLAIVKDGPATAGVGDSVVFTFTVRHDETGDGSPVENVTVSDDVAGSASYISGDDGDGVLQAEEVWTFTASYTIQTSDVGLLVNTGTVAGVDLDGDDITAQDTHSTAIAQPAPKQYNIYLPMVQRQQTVGAADLVVESISVTSNNVQVVIKNQGSAPVTDAFWIDLYVNPHPAPTGVNQTWDDGRCTQGIVWGVAGEALPLEPGETLVLTVGDQYYWPTLSAIAWPLPEGTPIYVQVDSASTETNYGSVLENHEINAGDYNNISGPVLSTLGSSGKEPEATEPTVTGDGSSTPSGNLPSRP